MDVAAKHFENGVKLWRAGNLQQSACEFKKATLLNPDFAEAYNNLGNVLLGLGRIEQSINVLQKAVALKPQYAQAFNNLGNALCVQEKYAEGAAAYRRALALQANWPEVQENLSAALNGAGDLDRAISAMRAAVADRSLTANDGQRLSSLGHNYKEIGKLDLAIDCFTRAGELGYRPAHSNRLFLLQYHPDYDATAILRQHQDWNNRVAQPLASSILPHQPRSAGRRLRIGYVSPDFRLHCQALFTTPLLRHHDHERFEIYCYCDVAKPDGITRRLSTLADTWRNVAGMSDAALAELIRGDRIDILVDLTMHMAGGRPLLFARKPAPVQIAWLAYPGTTGLWAMDYRLTDPYLDPLGTNDAFYSEKSVRLPQTFWCYDPLGMQIEDDAALPEVGPLPATRDGVITFGCLNNFCKINDTVLRLWARVLTAVSKSRLLLLAPTGSCRQILLEKLVALGVDAQRVEFVGRQPRARYLSEFNRIDICLDTIPYNGHTTSLDSLWMGVPVVTRIGETVSGRAGFSQLSNLGMTEWAGFDDEKFVAIACQAAQDMDHLTELRRTLRQRLMDSPLTQATRFARDIENAYENAVRALP